MAQVSYKIETEIPVSYTEKLLDFIQKKYMLPQKERFSGITRKKTETGSYLSYSVRNQKGELSLQVQVKASKPLEIEITPIGEEVTDVAIEGAPRGDLRVSGSQWCGENHHHSNVARFVKTFIRRNNHIRA